MLTSSSNPTSPRKKINRIDLIADPERIMKQKSYSLRRIARQTVFNSYGSDFLKKQMNQLPKQQPGNDQQIQSLRGLRKKKFIVVSTAKLSPIKQYQTKLKISAQSWLVFDYRKDSYKRGWRPADIGQFSGMTRLLLLKVYLQLQKLNPQLKTFNLRVNTNYLKEQVKMKKQEKLLAYNKRGLIYNEPISRMLGNNTLINIIDLFYGLFMTNHDDIIQYGIIFLGYLCDCQLKGKNPISQQSPCHWIDKITQAQANAKYFTEYITQHIFSSLQMTSSTFHHDTYIFESCANDICRLHLSIEQSSLFKQLIQCQELTCRVKYQTGFRYWENRTIVVKNRRIRIQGWEFVGCWKGKKNYGVVAKNQQLNILVVLQDCKYGMAQCDINNIQSWVKDVMKPIVDLRKTHSKLLPSLRPGDSPKKLGDKSIQKLQKLLALQNSRQHKAIQQHKQQQF